MSTVGPAAPKSALAPPDLALISQTVRTKLPFQANLASLSPLAGDASNRRYFRAHLSDGPVSSTILMQLAEPEAFKASEEAVSGAASAVTELPFLNVRRHLSQAGTPVPSLYHYDATAGLLYLEDFGDLTLAEAAQKGSPAARATLYREAIDILVEMHVRGSAKATDACLAFTRSFDVPLLMWEFDHFLEYGIVARRGRPMCAEDAQPIHAEFRNIAELMAAQPRVFTHRDYHSRNLMVCAAPAKGRRLGVIDFQDALMGPASYDLASLLRDAYIALDEELIDELVSRYLDGVAKQGKAVTDRRAFRQVFDFTSIQRNLKAAGRFVYVDRVKGNPKFLADIPRVLGYVRHNLERYSELATLRKHLTPYVPELQ
ncbi:MAG: phosphotransferase [Nitrospirae bacterium]|nr:phosphotransferase [Nitrospirota bacterium]